MYTRFKIFGALVLAGFVLAGTGTASAATVNGKVKPRLSTTAQAPKIVVPKICRNSISRSFGGFTAKKCS